MAPPTPTKAAGDQRRQALEDIPQIQSIVEGTLRKGVVQAIDNGSRRPQRPRERHTDLTPPPTL